MKSLLSCFAVVMSALNLASCVSSKPFSQALPPGSHPEVHFEFSPRLKNEIGYTDAGLQMASSQGLLGIAIGSAMRSEDIRATKAFQAKWAASSRNAWGEVEKAYRDAFSAAGYNVTSQGGVKVEVYNSFVGISRLDPNKKGTYVACLFPMVAASLQSGRHAYIGPKASANSDTTFEIGTLSPDVYAKALREAATKSARKVMTGMP